MMRSSTTQRARLQAGFTLTELMVAVTGGLLLAIAVFALARDSTRFYRSEARAGDATLAAIAGFQRLQADIQRAGLMASPNIIRDKRVCGIPTGTNAAWLSQSGAVRITSQTFALPTVLTDAPNSISPQVITIAANTTSSDMYPIMGVQWNGSVYEVTLQEGLGPLNRAGFTLPGANAMSDAAKEAILDDLFPPGRAMRIVDQGGRHYYGRIVDARYSANRAWVELDENPAVELRSGAAATFGCGLAGTSLGMASVVNFVRYEIRMPDDIVDATGAYNALYSDLNLGGASAVSVSDLTDFETSRTDLVRIEVDTNGSYINDSLEVVAEYAVDLRFGITFLDVNAMNLEQATSANLRTVAFGDSDFAAYAGDADVTAASPGRPDRIRSVRASLSVRSRMPDRFENVQGAPAGLYRVFLGNRAVPGGQRAHWARVRTLQADIALRNSEDTVWQ